MRPKLKLNHLRTLHDARYCSAVGVDLLGFSLQKDGENPLSPAQISEIMDWLSGPEAVGEFDYESPEEIKETALASKVHWISVPLDYQQSELSQLPEKIIFRSLAPIGIEQVDFLQKLASQFPQALFEYTIADDPTWDSIKAGGMIERSLLQYEDPDAIYTTLTKQGIKPFAFSLGDFVEEPDGNLDYQTCDDFLEEFQTLVTA